MKTKAFRSFILYLLAGILAAACGTSSTDTPEDDNAAVIAVPKAPAANTDTTDAPTGPAPIVAAPAKPLVTPTLLPPLPAGNPVPDDLATQYMFDLIELQPGQIEEATSTILESGDIRFIAVFLELMRARQLGIAGGSYRDTIDALETLSNRAFGDDWPAWIEWYGKTDLTPPPGFAGWKGRLLGRIDPEFASFLQDDHPSRIRVEEIQWGGVPVDGIPPLENPPMIPVGEADYLLPEEPVFGISINGDNRAYPLRIVDNHEMANDVVGGVPVSLAYCTLCGAAIAFDGRMPNGETTTFGTSGFLYRSNKLMYDRVTRTLWNQLTGEPVLGELAAEGDLRLDIFPVVLSTWQDWLTQHPDTQVLDRDTGVYPPEFYEPGVLYGGYFASEETMFPVWQRSDLLPDKAFVYTLYLDGIPKAYDVNALADREVVNDTIGGTNVVLIATQGTVTVNGLDRRAGPVIYTNGGEVRAYDRGDHLFTPGPEAYTVLAGDGRPWQVTEKGLVSPDGSEAPRLDGHLAYWFGWYAFFPETLLYTGE